MTHGNILNIVQNVITRQNRYKLVCACLMMLVSVLSFLAVGWNTYPIILIIQAILFLGGFALIYDYYRNRKIQHHEIYQNFQHRTKEIVWVYHEVTQVMPFGIHLYERYRIYIFKLDHEHFQLTLKEEELKKLIDQLSIVCDHATFGYSVEKEQLYKANPALLLRAD